MRRSFFQVRRDVDADRPAKRVSRRRVPDDLRCTACEHPHLPSADHSMPSSDASELGDELAFLGRVVTVSRQQHHRALYFQRLRLAHRRMVEAHACCKPSGLAPIGGAEAAVAAIERALHALPAPFALLRHQLAMTYFMPFALTCLASIGRAATLLAQLHAQVSTRATGLILRQNPEPPLLLALARKSDATTNLLVREFVAVAASPPAELPACRLGLREFVAAATLLPVELPSCRPSATAVPAVAPPAQATGAPTAPPAPIAPIAPTAPTALGIGRDDDDDVGEALEWSLDPRAESINDGGPNGREEDGARRGLGQVGGHRCVRRPQPGLARSAFRIQVLLARGSLLQQHMLNWF